MRLTEKPELLIEHYQKTYELTYQLWSQRNRTFLLLLAVIGAAAVLTYRPSDANPLLAAWLGKLLGLQGEARVAKLQGSFPFALLHSALLVVVFSIAQALDWRRRRAERIERRRRWGLSTDRMQKE